LSQGLKRLIREPLVHFLLIGAALFLFFDLMGGSDRPRDERIVISAGDIDRLAATWHKQWMRPPTERELQGLIDAQIREEVLYREARAMGLDEGDTIVRRRLAQKLEFVAQDLAAQTEPSEQELQDFLESEPERFRQPVRLSFSHVYVSPDRRGETAEPDARQVLEELRQGADPQGLGDRFMLQGRYADRTLDEIDRLFGIGFGAALDQIEDGAWQGPVESGYGLHLVRVERRVESRMPLLEEIRDKVRVELMSRLRKEANEAMVARLRSKYRVAIEWPGEEKAEPDSP
jgi:peptidyl-prolyl cis-trans isomerase C